MLKNYPAKTVGVPVWTSSVNTSLLATRQHKSLGYTHLFAMCNRNRDKVGQQVDDEMYIIIWMHMGDDRGEV